MATFDAGANEGFVRGSDSTTHMCSPPTRTSGTSRNLRAPHRIRARITPPLSYTLKRKTSSRCPKTRCSLPRWSLLDMACASRSLWHVDPLETTLTAAVRLLLAARVHMQAPKAPCSRLCSYSQVFVIGGYGGPGTCRDFYMDVHILELDTWSWTKARSHRCTLFC
eukprot:868271-Pleurochrysis_carterae.AAC.2